MELKSSIQTFGQLRCRVIDAIPEDKSVGLLVIMNHGFGASGDDLADFGPMLIESSEAISNSCRFVFPEAPIDLGPMGMPGGRAWWPINMAALAEMNQTRDFEKLIELEPPGMQEATQMLLATIHAALADADLDDSRLVLGGFSQGAMVSTCATLTKPLVPSLLALFSGTLLDRKRWTELAANHPGCSVLQSHGRQDPVLPFAPAERLKDLLSVSGFTVEFVEFNGPHTIPMNVLQRLQQKLEELVPQG
jgi:phospholipase/carboxylesterase